MNKKHMTRTDLKMYDKVYLLGSGNDKWLKQLRKIQPVGYNAGIYGWNYDVYSFWVDGQSVAVIEGYRPPNYPMIDNEQLDMLLERDGE